ncbi:DNRLRE domain-containing protein [Streptomyces sp. NPDC002623]
MLLAAETALVSEASGMAFASGSAAADAKPAASAPARALGPAQAQDEASAVLMARLQKREIEVLSARAADSTTYALPNGQLKTVAYAGPVRVKHGTQWKDIDTSLSDTGAELTPAVAVADVAVSDGGDTQLASVAKGTESFGLGWEDKLPVPEVKDSTASYDLGAGQTLSVTALAQGFSESITLTRRPEDESASYRIPLNLHGLKLSQADSGHLLLKNTDGGLVAEAPAPMMWDASKDPASGESAHQERVATKIETASDGTQTLVLTPDKDFLATATYPVTVDPTTTLAVTTDTWLQTPDYPDSQVSSQELKSGTYDSGSDLARSYLKFDVSKFAGKHITDTNFALYNYYASTCSTSGSGTTVRRITSSWASTSVTWATRPSSTGTGAVVNLVPHGYDSSCPAAWSNWDIDAIVQAWADGSPNYGVMVYGTSETDSTTWRRFRSANYTTAGYAPKLTVTYNSYATTASAAVSPSVVSAYSGTRYVSSLTPTLSAKVTDAEGGTVEAQFEITPDPAYADTSYSYTKTPASVASGGTAKLTVPSANALPNGKHLRFRVRGNDFTDYGSWSGYTYFATNTGLPNTPSISCPDYPQNTWSAKASGSVTCTLDTTSTDGRGYLWGLDDPSLPTTVNDTTNGDGGDPLTVTIAPGDGWHTLYGKAVDVAGNVSGTAAAYSFGIGADGAGLLTPADGDTTARRVSLTALGRTSYTGVTYQYRRGETDSWHNVPVTDVTKSSDGSAVSAWPVAVTNGSPAALTWNITTSLTENGPIDLRAAFTDGTTTGYSQANTVTVDRDAGTAPSEDVGPGEVNTLTGDFTLSATDASGFGLSVSRTASSRRPAAGTDAEGQAAIFGPQWTSGVVAELTDSSWVYVRMTSTTSVAVVDGDGNETGFTATGSGGWKPQPGAENLKLTGSLTGSFTLTEATDGTTTTFAKADAAATTWQLSSTYLPTDTTTTKIVSEPVTSGGATLARPKYLIAPTSAVPAATCETTPTTAGCRVLEFVYATATTATATDLGDYTGRLKQIKQWATDPGASAATATIVAGYAYDAAGRLREAWDPRISPALKTAYTYDSAGRVATLTSPGEVPWTFTYGKAGAASTAGEGMLLKASRPNLTAGSQNQTDGTTATTSVAYDVPLSGTKAPYSMAASNVATWGQSDVPADATAVFPADSVPLSNTGSDLAATDYTRATITYTDASGRGVNTATPGGHITTTDYDRFGNTVRELTAVNRELALATSGEQLTELALLGIDGMTTADRADQLSTRSDYSSDGLRETDEYGPLHRVTLALALQAGTGGTDLPAGAVVPARKHTAHTYDEGRPTDGTAAIANQVTTTEVGAYVGGYPSDADVRTTATQYDWAKGASVATVADPGGLALKTSLTYDSQGRVSKSSLPKAAGSDAGTMVATYYAATGTGTCNGRPEWADLLCSTAPAGAISGGGSNPSQLPTKTLEYDRWGNVAKTIETANGTTRTTVTTYDGAGRPKTKTVTGGTGTAVPDTATTYDTATGRVATVSSGGRTVTHTYDTRGREISYNDGAGNTTTTAYDALDRPVKTTDSAPSTTTYTYDTSKNPRGVETSRSDSAAGTLTSAYDADGRLTGQTLPGGYTATFSQDETGAETSRVYTRDSDGTVVAADATDHTVHGQTVTETGSNGQTRTRSYTYDAAGRLTRADDTAPDGSCTRRDYTFDSNTNRTALATATSDVGADCTSTGATTTTYTYDTADRLVSGGTVYDAFNRTTTQADGDTVAYYANDLVRQLTSGASRQTWTLDAAGRLGSWTTETQGTDGTWSQTSAETSHYGRDGDLPAWTADGTTVTRNVQDAGSRLAATTSATGDTVLQLTDLHGDTVVQLPLDTTKSPVASAFDEYGNPESDTGAARYGWLGGRQRATTDVSSAVLMGVRLYDPSTGRFLQTDPIYGGGASAYDYCGADPVNCTDLAGKAWWSSWWFKAMVAMTIRAVVEAFVSVYAPWARPWADEIGQCVAGACVGLIWTKGSWKRKAKYAVAYCLVGAGLGRTTRNWLKNKVIKLLGKFRKQR